MKRATVSVLVVISGLLVLLPLAWGVLSGARFGGTDAAAQMLARDVSPGFSPWARLPFAQPSPEMEGMLFALQAAGGAAFIGYYLGYRSGLRRGRGEQHED